MKVADVAEEVLVLAKAAEGLAADEEACSKVGLLLAILPLTNVSNH